MAPYPGQSTTVFGLSLVVQKLLAFRTLLVIRGAFFLQPEMDFLGDIWQAIRALGIPPVPLPDRVVWALDTEEDFFFSLSRERKMKRVRAVGIA